MKENPTGNASCESGTLVGEFTYQKPGIWEVFQPQTFTLPRRLHGVTNLTIVSEDKFFLKEFHFTKQEKALCETVCPHRRRYLWRQLCENRGCH